MIRYLAGGTGRGQFGEYLARYDAAVELENPGIRWKFL